MNVRAWRNVGEKSLRNFTLSKFFWITKTLFSFYVVIVFLFLNRYEKEGRAKRVVKAQQLWYAIIESQTETGTPYMLYKDACNRKSNQQNLGTIKSSNLCTEIVEYTSKDEVNKYNYRKIRNVLLFYHL